MCEIDLKLVREILEETIKICDPKLSPSTAGKVVGKKSITITNGNIVTILEGLYLAKLELDDLDLDVLHHEHDEDRNQTGTNLDESA